MIGVQEVPSASMRGPVGRARRTIAALSCALLAAASTRAEAQDLAALTSETCATRADGTEACADACGSFLGDRAQAEGFDVITRWRADDPLAPLALRDAAGVPSTHTFRGARRSTSRSPVPGLAHVTALSSTPEDACAIDDAGAVWCWGRPLGGRGDAAGGSALGPTPIRVETIDDATLVVVGVETRAAPDYAGPGLPAARSACAITASRGVACWSWLVERARQPPVLVPVVVPRTEGALELTSTAISGNDFCALRPGGVVSCWNVLRWYGNTTCGEARARCASPRIEDPLEVSLPEPIASVQQACVLGAEPERRAYCLAPLAGSGALRWSRVPELDGSVEIRSARGWARDRATCARDAAGTVRCRYWVSRDGCP